MRILLQWSGGVESTSLLQFFLQNSRHEVVAHYVRMITNENRWPQEDLAIAMLKPHLRTIRPFQFSVSELSLISGQGLGEDAQLQFPISLIAARHHRVDRIYRAYCLEDDWFRYRDLITVVKRETVNDHHKILSGFLYKHEVLESLCPPHPLNRMSKAWHWRHLGDLANLTWSCRRPVKDAACGRCHSCLERAAAMRGTSNIKEIADLLMENPNA